MFRPFRLKLHRVLLAAKSRGKDHRGHTPALPIPKPFAEKRNSRDRELQSPRAIASIPPKYRVFRQTSLPCASAASMQARRPRTHQIAITSSARRGGILAGAAMNISHNGSDHRMSRNSAWKVNRTCQAQHIHVERMFSQPALGQGLRQFCQNDEILGDVRNEERWRTANNENSNGAIPRKPPHIKPRNIDPGK